MKSDLATPTVDAVFTPGRFALFLGLVLFAAFPEVFLGTHTFFYRDYLNVVYPYAQYNHDCFWRGELPLWNPLNHCGVPYLAQWQTFVLYPGWWIFLPFPPSFSLGIFCLVHVFAAGLAMYFLAQRWTGSRLGACLAGVVYACNGMMQNSFTWPHILAALAWAPVVILLVEQSWRRGGQKILWAAGAGAMQMLTGAPEQILFTWFVLGALLLLDMARNLAPQMFAQECASSWKITGGRFVAVGLLVAALAAAQLLPFLDLFSHSQRSAAFAATADARPGGLTWAVPGWGWANLFVPLFASFPTPSGVYFQSSQYLVSSYYLGLGALAFCVGAMWRVQTARVFLFGGIFLGSFLLALGENSPVYGWAQKVFPAIGFLRYPAKFMFLASLVAPILIAEATSYFQKVKDAERPEEIKRALGLAFLFLLVTAGLLWFAKNHPFSPALAQSWPAVWQNGWSRLLLFAFVVGLLLGGHFARAFRARALLAAGVVVLFWLDLHTHAPVSPNPTVPRWTYAPGLAKMEPRPQPGQSRALVTLPTQLKFLGFQSPQATNDVLFNRLILLHQGNLLDGIPVTGGAHTLLVPESDRVAGLLLTTNATPLAGVADFLGIAQMSDEQTLDWKPRFTFLPIATIGQQPVFADEKATFAALAQPSFDPRQTVYLPLAAQALSQNVKSSSARILSTNFTSARIDLQVESASGAWLVLAQSFYHSWQAQVNGRPVKIWPANAGFQALEVPGGRCEVTLVYKDRAFFIGAILSALAWLGCGLAGGAGWFRRFVSKSNKPSVD